MSLRVRTALERRRQELKEAAAKKAKPKTFRIRMSELKRIIKEEAKRARLLKEQGRPVSIPLGRPTEPGEMPARGRGRPEEDRGGPYSQRELLHYVMTFDKEGRGRPAEWQVDNGTELMPLSTKELMDAYDEKSTTAYDVYSPDGEHLGELPLSL